MKLYSCFAVGFQWAIGQSLCEQNDEGLQSDRKALLKKSYKARKGVCMWYVASAVNKGSDIVRPLSLSYAKQNCISWDHFGHILGYTLT